MIPAPRDTPTYEPFAPYYDACTAGYKAERWTGRLAALAEGCGVSGRRLLDVGCGTGKSFLPMLERGWEVVGCDLSPAMLEIAKEKVGEEVRLEVADVRELPVFGEFDLVWALNDTLNNLLSPSELQAAIEGMGRNLAPGGAILFDLNTLMLHRQLHEPRTETQEVEGRTMSWTGLATEEVEAGSTWESRFEIEGDPAATHVHRQRHFPEPEVLAAIEAAGLKSLGVWGDYEGAQDQPLDEERHQKAIYVASHSKSRATT